MSEDNVLLFEDAQIKSRVNKVWEIVFNTSSVVATHAKRFGFNGMTLIPNPNIHEMLGAIRLLDVIIDTFLNDAEMEYDETRLMLNAKKQLTTMNVVAAALSANNRPDFDRAMESLENQAAF